MWSFKERRCGRMRGEGGEGRCRGCWGTSRRSVWGLTTRGVAEEEICLYMTIYPFTSQWGKEEEEKVEGCVGEGGMCVWQ